MSWRTAHFGKQDFEHGRGVRRRQRSSRTKPFRRGNGRRRKMGPGFFEATGSSLQSNALQRIFGTSLPARALRIAIRIKRAIRRDPHVPLGRVIRPSVISGKRMRWKYIDGKFQPDRNVHHLTPKSRKGELFFGNYRCNMILMKIERHTALHDEFGMRTWEEIIMIISQYVAMEQAGNFAAFVEEYLHLVHGLRKKSCKRIAHQVMRDLRNGICPGMIPGHILFFWSGRRESNPVDVLPKHAYCRYMTARIVLCSPFKVSYFWIRIKPANAFARLAPADARFAPVA